MSGMSDMDFRLECLRLASGKISVLNSMPGQGTSKTDIDLALEYYDFIKFGGSRPEPLKSAA